MPLTDDEDAPAISPWRRIARNTIAVFLVVFFIVALLLPYRLAAAASAATAALYAVAQGLATRERADDETIH